MARLETVDVSRRLRTRVFGLVSLRLLIAALLCVEIALVGAWWQLRESALVKDWFPNLGTELAAIVLALVVVDEVLRGDRRRRYAQTRAIAAKAIIEPLLPLMPRAIVGVTGSWPPHQEHPEYRDAHRLFSDWVHKLESTPTSGYDVWESWFRDLRRVADSWREVTGRYASVLDNQAEVNLVQAIDDYVTWTSLNRERLDSKLELFYVHLANIREALSADPSLNSEELWHAVSYGDPRPSIVKFLLSPLRRIVNVLDLHRQAFGAPPSVPASVLKEVMSPTPSSAIVARVESDPLELD